MSPSYKRVYLQPLLGVFVFLSCATGCDGDQEQQSERGQSAPESPATQSTATLPDTADKSTEHEQQVNRARDEAVTLMAQGKYEEALDVYINLLQLLPDDAIQEQRMVALGGLAVARAVVSALGQRALPPTAAQPPVNARSRLQIYAEDVSQQERFRGFVKEFVAQLPQQHFSTTISDERYDLRATESLVHPTIGVVTYTTANDVVRELYVVEFVEDKTLWWQPISAKSISLDRFGRPKEDAFDLGAAFFDAAAQNANQEVSRKLRLTE